jgi:hypothetical protein
MTLSIITTLSIIGLIMTLGINPAQHTTLSVATITLSFVMLSSAYAKCRVFIYAEFHYTECHYAECRGALVPCRLCTVLTSSPTLPAGIGLVQGQTLAKRTKPGPSFQQEMWSCIYIDEYMNIIKTAQL